MWERHDKNSRHVRGEDKATMQCHAITREQEKARWSYGKATKDGRECGGVVGECMDRSERAKGDERVEDKRAEEGGEERGEESEEDKENEERESVMERQNERETRE